MGFKLVKEYQDIPLSSLMKSLEDLQATAHLEYTPQTHKDIKKENSMRQDVIKIYLAERLGLTQFDHIHYLIDSIKEVFNKNEKRIKELEKFKKHRHKTILGTYSETPIY